MYWDCSAFLAFYLSKVKFIRRALKRKNLNVKNKVVRIVF